MLPDSPPSRSERLLRSTLQRASAPDSPSPKHRRSHSHAPATAPATTSTAITTATTSTSTDDDNDDDDQLSRASFLYRTAATATSPIRFQPHHHRHSPCPSRPASPSLRPASPSPSFRRLSLQRSPPADSTPNLQRHSSIPARKKPASLVEPLPLTPHEQVLRARLERVLNSSRVVDERERSRERRRSVNTDREHRDAQGWLWSEKEQRDTPSPPPPRSNASASSDHSHYHYPLHHQPHQQHHRSRSKTDPVSPPPAPPSTPRRAATMSPHSMTTSPYSVPRRRHQQSPLPSRDNSNSSSAGTTPPLTADGSPVLGLGDSLMQHQQQHQQQPMNPDDMRLLTPPPTPPLAGTHTPGSAQKSLYRTQSRESEYTSSPYLYSLRHREGSVERLDLGMAVGGPHLTFNARKASDRCRMMEGYVSFANVEGLGTPPDGVDDEEQEEQDKCRREDKQGRGIGAIGGWARKLLFVGTGIAGNSTTTTAMANASVT